MQIRTAIWLGKSTLSSYERNLRSQNVSLFPNLATSFPLDAESAGVELEVQFPPKASP